MASYDKFFDAPTIVYWDTVDCPIPKGLDAETVVNNITQGLGDYGYRNVTKIKAYGDVFEMVTDKGGFATVGLPMCHVPTGSERACRNYILIDSLYDGISQDRELNLMLILGDISGSREFKHAFAFLQNRPNLNFLLAQPDVSSASKPKFKPVETVWVWSSLCEGEGPFEDEDEGKPATVNEWYLAHLELFGLDSDTDSD